MLKRVAIDFCCNDPADGSFAGRVVAANYADCDLEADDWEKGFKFSVGDGYIRLQRRKFKFVGRTFWLGNWCWDRFFFTRAEAKRLLGCMRRNGWKCTGGPVRLADWFDKEQVR